MEIRGLATRISGQGLIATTFMQPCFAFRLSGKGGTGDLPISAAATAVSLGGESS